MIKESNLLFEKRLKALGIFSLGEEEAQWGGLIMVIQYFKGAYKDDGSFLFTRSPMEETWGNRYKWYWEKFHLSIRKKSFTVKIVAATTSPGTW